MERELLLPFYIKEKRMEKKMVDLSAFAMSDTTNVVLKDALGRETEAWIKLAGRASKQYKSVVDKWTIKREAKRDKQLSASESKQFQLELLAKCCLDSNFSLEGKEIKEYEDFHDMLSDPRYYTIKDQLDEALGLDELFAKKSANG